MIQNHFDGRSVRSNERISSSAMETFEKPFLSFKEMLIISPTNHEDKIILLRTIFCRKAVRQVLFLTALTNVQRNNESLFAAISTPSH